MTTAIVLFSGGLDSLLTTRILQSQNIDVIGLHVVTPFQDSSKEASLWAEKMGIELIIRPLGGKYMALLAHPKWGVGKGFNPCIDCRIAMCRAAKELMEERGADFVATGEVSGQRPNSQKLHQLNLITRESGLKGKLLRPLSAKTLTPTEMEKEGIVDREKLFSYTGRNRKNLMRRAKTQFDIHPVPQPSTGCLLAEKSFAPRVRDLLRYQPNPSLWDGKALIAGRHLRIDEKAKIIVARRKADCDLMVALFHRADRSPSFLLTPENFNGPAALLILPEAPCPESSEKAWTEETEEYLKIAGGLILRFSNPEKRAHLTGPATVLLFWGKDGQEERPIYPHSVADTLSMIEEELPQAKSAPSESAVEESPLSAESSSPRSESEITDENEDGEE